MRRSMNRKDIDEVIRQYAMVVGYIACVLYEQLGAIIAVTILGVVWCSEL